MSLKMPVRDIETFLTVECYLRRLAQGQALCFKRFTGEEVLAAVIMAELPDNISDIDLVEAAEYLKTSELTDASRLLIVHCYFRRIENKSPTRNRSYSAFLPEEVIYALAIMGKPDIPPSISWMDILDAASHMCDPQSLLDARHGEQWVFSVNMEKAYAYWGSLIPQAV